jgi:hypothetical protein
MHIFLDSYYCHLLIYIYRYFFIIIDILIYVQSELPQESHEGLGIAFLWVLLIASNLTGGVRKHLFKLAVRSILKNQDSGNGTEVVE